MFNTIRRHIIASRSCRAMSSRSFANKSPVRLVLFDVFDITKKPSEAVSPKALLAPSRSGRLSNQEINAKHHLYGKHSSPPITPEQWWSELIQRCIVNAGAEEADVQRAMPILGPSLLSRFESDKGYKLFPETAECCLHAKSNKASDELIIVLTLEALGILPQLSFPPTLSWDVEHAKPDSRIYEAACKRCGEEPGEGVLMVGDELKADYEGAVGAGLEGRLVRRQGEWSDGAERKAQEELKDVTVIRSLDEIVREVEFRN